MAHFKRLLTHALRNMANAVRGVHSLSAIVGLLTTRYQLHHTKLTQMVHVLLHNNPRAFEWVPLAHDEYMPYQDAVDGVMLRVIPDEQAIEGGYILREWLEPFIPEDIPVYIGRASLPCLSQGPDVLVLHDWYEAQHIQHGDHILVEIRWRNRCELHLRVDRVAKQHLADTVLAAHDVATQLNTRWHATQNIEELYTHVLAIYATAPWRGSYPAMPWQSIVNAQSSAPIVLSRLELLRMRIHDLQDALRMRRATDSAQGLWDGIALRYSAIRMFIDTQYDDTTTHRVTPIDTRIDHSFAIDDAIARGVYDVHYAEDDTAGEYNAEWSGGDEFATTDESYTAALQSGDDEIDSEESDATSWDADDIDSETFVSLFANRHPALHAWSTQLLSALNDHERRMMIRAESDDDHNAILSAAMQRILPQLPQLMQTLRVMPITHSDHTLGGKTYAAFEHAEQLATHAGAQASTDVPSNEIDRAIDGDAVFIIELALRESYTDLRTYEQWLPTQRVRAGSVRQRVQALRELAMFLAQYYTTTINDATYAMLDEYFFFHYPRHTSSGSMRMIRTRIGYVRDYYAYRATLGDTRAYAAAQAIHASRQQAADVLDVLLRIQQYPHAMTTLVVHLFAPYTV